MPLPKGCQKIDQKTYRYRGVTVFFDKRMTGQKGERKQITVYSFLHNDNLVFGSSLVIIVKKIDKVLG